MTQNRGERELSLRHIKGGDGFAKRFAVNARNVLVRSVAHRGMVAIDIQRAHSSEIIARRFTVKEPNRSFDCAPTVVS